jgi:pimeloyl-ACP methyl ester carboxylesterase
MTFETEFYAGRRNMPLAVFIHGMGMNAKVWSNPHDARILGGKYPLRVLLGGIDEMRTSFMDLRDIGFSVLSWKQRRPAGPMNTAVAELKYLIYEYRNHIRDGIILVGHSRGGLIARKYLEERNEFIRGFITIATPHHGTTMAKWAAHISPIASLLNQLLGEPHKKDIRSVLKRILGFLSSEGLKELLPDAKFYSGLKDVKHQGVRYISIGGTSPDILKINSIPMSDFIIKAIPERLIPEELREGYGDGLVSASSSVLPYADMHYDFHVNHVRILFDRQVRECIINAF